MKRITTYIAYLWIAAFVLSLGGCTDEIVDQSKKGEGTLLKLYVNIGDEANTRLAELPHDKIGTEAGLKKYSDVGLYIYYEDDYKNGDLSKPYIRNLRMTYDGGKLVVADLNAAKDIYIYDRMTIVALYPYNKDAKDFSVARDEEGYYFSESDYKQQLYIPYRSCDEINPTNAYTAQIHFYPKQTCKVQIVLTADNPADFPTYESDKNDKSKEDASITILPAIDPVTTDYIETIDRREHWIDAYNRFPEDDADRTSTVVGGKYVRRYTSYIWTTGANDTDIPHHDGNPHHNNIIQQGDILFHSDKLTLVVPATVNLAERQVYRYGYDLDSGEMFIPTSETLVYDATSLQKVSFNSYRAYQVCDIDWTKTGKNFTPKEIYDATYDGGGHIIKGLSLNKAVSASANNDDSDYKPGKQAFGLFGTLSGTSKLMNIHLVEPSISIVTNASKDTCYVGALCGLLNPDLSLEDLKKKIWDALPPELSIPVKEALLAEALRNPQTTTCYIEGCKVENPMITVTGDASSTFVIAGGFCGGAGNQKQKGKVTESYLLQTNTTSCLKIHENESATVTPYLGSFCGLLANGEITKSYTTMAINVTAPYTNSTQMEAAVNFCYQYKTPIVTDCRTTMTSGATTANPPSDKEKEKGLKVADAKLFSNSWPTESEWPLFANQSNSPFLKWPCVAWKYYWADLSSSASSYPKLMWETKPYLENN